MSDIVGIHFLELVRIDVMLLCELTLPEDEGLLQGEANSLQEETELKSTIMLKVMLVLQGSEKGLHAWWEVLTRVEVKIGHPNLVSAAWSHWLLQVEVNRAVV